MGRQRALYQLARAFHRLAVRRRRLELNRSRDGAREWQVTRRERTRQLIELGGLIAKAGLIDLTDDDRAVIFGLLVDTAARLRSDDRERQLLLWRRRGQRAFVDPPSPNEHGSTGA